MRLPLLLFYCIAIFSTSYGQDTFIRYSNHGTNENKPIVVATPDLGWVLYSPDSFLLYKYNACGVLQWGKHFHITASVFSGLDFFIGTRKKGFAFLALLDGPNGRFTQVVNLDSAGNILWSKVLKDSEYEQTTYSLGQDPHGNFMVYANASKIGGGEVYNMISKISEEGNYLWTRFYNHGGIWGGAICTSDNGYLARTGNNFIKTDAEGLVQWSSLFQTGGQFYYAPLEVADGYILTGRSNLSAEYAIAKLTKSGTSAWPHKKVLTQFLNFPFFSKCPNGNVAAIANRFGNVQSQFGVIEYTSDFDFVRHSGGYFDNIPIIMNGNSLTFRNDGIPLLAGSFLLGDAPSLPKLFFAKMNAQYQTGCDTVLPPFVVKLEPVDASPVATVSTLHPFLFNHVPLEVSTVSSETFTLCGQLQPLEIHIDGDRLLCQGQTGKLRQIAGDLFDRYLWNNGQTTAEINVTEPGKYWLQATNSCRAESVTDTIEVKQFQFPPQTFPGEYSLCNVDTVVLDATLPGVHYVWNTGDTTATILPSKAGMYSVRLTSMGCTTDWKTEVNDCEQIEMPNLFTPNDDQINDHFIARKWKGILQSELKIYNRWGQMIFTSNDFSKTGWDGTGHNGGIYYWLLKYTNFENKVKTLKGTIQMVK